MKSDRRKILTRSLGPVICPKCGRRGILTLKVRINPDTRYVENPKYGIFHSLPVEMDIVNSTTVRLHRKWSSYMTCWLGKLTFDEVEDFIRDNRPWAALAHEIRELVEKVVDDFWGSILDKKREEVLEAVVEEDDFDGEDR